MLQSIKTRYPGVVAGYTVLVCLVFNGVYLQLVSELVSYWFILLHM